MIVLCADRLFTPQEELLNPLLFIEDGLIRAVSSRTEQEIPKNATVSDFTRDLPGAVLPPGFVDIHMHAGAGVDVLRTSLAELPRLNEFLTEHGVTGYFPTTVAAPLDQTCTALDRLADAIEETHSSPNGDAVQAPALCVSLVGPLLLHKPRGGYSPAKLV